MELIHALRTTGSVRGFTGEPVADATVAAILDDARFAPSGGNRQPWKVAVVQDLAARRAMADLMRPVWHEYAGAVVAGLRPFAYGSASEAPAVAAPPVEAPNSLIDEIESIPVALAVAADLNLIALMDGNLDRPPITGGASIHPFCWSILLAARARGLGGVLTTFLSRAEPAAAAVLGLPPDHALAATIFLGVPTHQNTRLNRNPVESFTTLDRFDGPTFAG